MKDEEAMVTVGMNYRVRPGKEVVFERACRGVIRAMAGAAGHVRTRLYQDVDDPASYLILSEWRDREAFEAFTRSETFAKVTRWGREEILAGRPHHEIYGD